MCSELEREYMGATQAIWNAMEVAEEAKENSSSHIQSSSLTIDSSLSLPDLTPAVIELCKDLFKKWSKLDDSCFSVEFVSCGITNLLLKVSVLEENGNEVSVTVRLYGPNTDYVINREREFQVIKYLSAAGFGAKLLGVFENGMVQSFINARTLTPQDMRKPNLATEIVRQLHKFHEVDISVGFSCCAIFRLQFDDLGKQKKYETISFKEVYNEIAEIRAKMSPIDFDYVGYFFLRYDEFKRQKQETCSLARSYLSGQESG